MKGFENEIEKILEAKLLGKWFNKKELALAISDTVGVHVGPRMMHREHECGCDDWFSVDIEVSENTDAYIEVYFRHTPKSTVYYITEVNVDVNDWSDDDEQEAKPARTLYRVDMTRYSDGYGYRRVFEDIAKAREFMNQAVMKTSPVFDGTNEDACEEFDEMVYVGEWSAYSPSTGAEWRITELKVA